MEIPLRHGLCSLWNTKTRLIVVGFTVMFCLFLVVDANEEQQGSTFLRNRLKKKHLLNHRLERQTGFPSLYQTYRYDQDVNIGILVNLHHDVSYADKNGDNSKNDKNDIIGDDYTKKQNKGANENPIFQRRGMFSRQGKDGKKIPNIRSNQCGPINLEAVQQVLAAKWAIDVINNQSLPHEIKIGLQIHDTCSQEDITRRHLYHIISIATRDGLGASVRGPAHNVRPSTASSILVGDSDRGSSWVASNTSQLGVKGWMELSRGWTPPLLGMIGIGEPAHLTETTGALHAFNIPLVSVVPPRTSSLLSSTASGNQMRSSYSNMLTTAPDMAGQARAVVNLAYELDIDSVALISSSSMTVETFLAEATALGIRVPNILELNRELLKDHGQKQVQMFLEKAIYSSNVKSNGKTHPPSKPVVALIVEAGEAIAIGKHLYALKKEGTLSIDTNNILWLIGSLGLDLRSGNSDTNNKKGSQYSIARNRWKSVFKGGIFVEPHMPELAEFKRYFLETVKNPDKKLRSILKEYKKEIFGRDQNENEDHDSPNSSLGSFIPTPKPRKRRKLFPQNHFNNNNSENEGDMESEYYQDPHVSFVVKAVSALTAAFRLVQLEQCVGNLKDDPSFSRGEVVPEPQKECFRRVHPGLHKSILSNMRKLSFRSTERFSASQKPENSEAPAKSLPTDGDGMVEEEDDNKKMLKMMQIGDTQHHFTRNGHLVANKQLIYKVDTEEGVQSAGWYSEDEGLHLTSDLNIILEPAKSNSMEHSKNTINKKPSKFTRKGTTIEIQNQIDNFPFVLNGNDVADRTSYARSLSQSALTSASTNIEARMNPERIVVKDNIRTNPLVSKISHPRIGNKTRKSTNKPEENIVETSMVFSYEAFIGRTWALVVVSVAVFGACVSIWMLLYVFIKMCDGTLAGSNQTMGVLLLIGVTCLFASVVPWLLPPNSMICAARHFLHPLAMVLCFSILLVKAMQLRSLITIGLGGKIPQANQILSLLFMFAVQVVIAAEWFITSRPLGVRMSEGHYPECDISENRFFLLHIYPATLLVVAFFYGISVLKIKRNFNEGRWITCATLFVIPIFVAWSLTHHFAPIQFHDPSTAVSIVAVAGVLLSAIFLPKMHTIAQQTKYKNALQSGISSIDLQRSHSDSTVFTGFSEFSPHETVGGGRQHLQTNASSMHKLYQHHQPPHVIPPESSTNGNFYNPTTGTGGFIFPSSPYVSYNSHNSTVPIHQIPSSGGLSQNDHNGTPFQWPTHSDKISSSKKQTRKREYKKKIQLPSGPEFNGLNYIHTTSAHPGNSRIIHQHNVKKGQYLNPSRIQSYVDWNKELFPDYNFDADNTGGSSAGTLPGSHHYYNQSAAFYNKYNHEALSSQTQQTKQYPPHRIYTPAHYAPISNFPSMYGYGAEQTQTHKKERKSRKDDVKKRKTSTPKKRYKSSSPTQNLLVGTKKQKDLIQNNKPYNGMVDRYGMFGTSAPKPRRWRSHSGSSREEINESTLTNSTHNKLVSDSKTHHHPTFSANVPISSLVSKSNGNPHKISNNASKKRNDKIYKQNDTRMFIDNIRKKNDDLQDLVTTMVGGGIYHNYNSKNVDDLNGRNSSIIDPSVLSAVDATRERYNKILSTAMPATETPRNSKDDVGRNVLVNNSKTSNTAYFDLRSTRSRELQRHSRSPSDGMILTASGLTLDPSNPEYNTENFRKQSEEVTRNDTKPYTFFGLDPFITSTSQDKSNANDISKNKNEIRANYRDGEMIEFTTEQMSVSGNRLIIEGKEGYHSYNSMTDNERDLRSISGSLGETDVSIVNN